MAESGVREIQLRHGGVAVVDERDFDELNQFAWFVMRSGYVARATRDGRKCRLVLMHREVAKTPKGAMTDHISGNKLDNRRANLRVCSHQQNSCNRPARSDSGTGFKGVAATRFGRFHAKIHRPPLSSYLGAFKTAEEAARAYDAAAVALHGDFARLNFPKAA